MRIFAFHPNHASQIKLQSAQAYVKDDLLQPGIAESLANAGQSFTAIEGDQVIAIAGIAMQWEGRAIAWALVSEDAGKHFLTIHRAVKGFLDQCDIRRIEAFVDSDFEHGMKWMKMLGFENEGLMRKFSIIGNDCYLFARVK